MKNKGVHFHFELLLRGVQCLFYGAVLLHFFYCFLDSKTFLPSPLYDLVSGLVKCTRALNCIAWKLSIEE